MENNRVKKGLELSAAIIALAYCAIDLVFVLIDIITYSEYLEYLESEYIIGLLIGIGLVITELILSIALIMAIASNSIKKRLRISFITITSIMTFFLLIPLCTNKSGMSVIAFLVFICIIILESLVLGIKGVKTTNQVKQEVASADEITSKEAISIESKVKELKHLLDLGVITKEQYEAAIDKAVKQII